MTTEILTVYRCNLVKCSNTGLSKQKSSYSSYNDNLIELLYSLEVANPNVGRNEMFRVREFYEEKRINKATRPRGP